MLEQSYGLYFFLKQSKNPNAEGFRYVFLRITVNRAPKEVSTTHLWHHDRWDQKSGKTIGNKEDARTLNKHLESIENAATAAKTSLLDKGEEITANAIKKILKGGGDENKYLLVLYKEHNERIKALVETGEYSRATILKYNTSYDHVAAFILFKYGKENLAIKQIDFSFIEDFNYWLKAVRSAAPIRQPNTFLILKRSFMIASGEDG